VFGLEAIRAGDDIVPATAPLLARITAAATRSRSAVMAGPMMSGCPILSLALSANHCGKRGANISPDFR
jgi:hypothetical protein